MKTPSLFHVTHDSFDTRGTPWITRIPKGLAQLPACAACGRRREEPRGPLEIILERPTGTHWPDVLGSGSYPIFTISGPVKRAWSDELGIISINKERTIDQKDSRQVLPAEANTRGHIAGLRNKR